MFPKLEEKEATKASPEPQSMSLSRILLPLLQQVGWNGSVHIMIDKYLVARSIFLTFHLPHIHPHSMTPTARVTKERGFHQ